MPPGTYEGSVPVADPAVPECAVTVDTGERSAWAVLAVAPAVVPTCERSFSYNALVTGGADPARFSYAWAFAGDGTGVPAASTAPSGVVRVGSGGVEWSARVLVQEARDGLVCEAQGAAQGTPFAPLDVHLALAAAAQSCPGMTGDGVTWNAVASGGNGAYALSWVGPACSGLTCTVDPDDATCVGVAEHSVAGKSALPAQPAFGDRCSTVSRCSL